MGKRNNLLRQRHVAFALNVTPQRLSFLRREGRLPADGQDGRGFYWLSQTVMDFVKTRPNAKRNKTYVQTVKTRLTEVIQNDPTDLHGKAGRPLKEAEG